MCKTSRPEPKDGPSSGVEPLNHPAPEPAGANPVPQARTRAIRAGATALPETRRP